MAGVQFKYGKKGGISELEKRLKTSVGNAGVKVGILEKSGAHKESPGLTVADVASFHEFGTENVVQRSFIRATVINKAPLFKKAVQGLLKGIILGSMNRERALGILGELAQAEMINTINAGISPPLAESTRRAKMVGGKAGDTPLVDSGQLKQSIRWEINR